MAVTVRPLRAEDYSQWRPLWDGYTHFMIATLRNPSPQRRGKGRSQRIHRCSAGSWRRTKRSSVSQCVFCTKAPVNRAHLLPEDLFVDAAERGAGAGKALIDALIEEGKREGWSKLYWVTRENNPARKLYDKYGEADDYVRYRLSL